MEKHKAPTQLPTNEPSLELQIFKKSIGGTLGGQLSQKLCFPSTGSGRAERRFAAVVASNEERRLLQVPCAVVGVERQVGERLQDGVKFPADHVRECGREARGIPEQLSLIHI